MNFIRTIFILMIFSGLIQGVCAQKVFKVSEAAQANVVVYISNEADQADLKVFEVADPSLAQKDGLWFETETSEEAYIRIYITQQESEAQIRVYYVESEDQAGWITEDKKDYYKVGK